jgi:hypothetical protein
MISRQNWICIKDIRSDGSHSCNKQAAEQEQRNPPERGSVTRSNIGETSGAEMIVKSSIHARRE